MAPGPASAYLSAVYASSFQKLVPRFATRVQQSSNAATLTARTVPHVPRRDHSVALVSASCQEGARSEGRMPSRFSVSADIARTPLAGKSVQPHWATLKTDGHALLPRSTRRCGRLRKAVVSAGWGRPLARGQRVRLRQIGHTVNPDR